MNSHYDPARDTIVIDNVFSPMHMDPSIRIVGGAAQPGSKVVIDATRSIEAGELSIPSRENMERARDTWRRAELPDFDDTRQQADWRGGAGRGGRAGQRLTPASVQPVQSD